MAAPAVAGFGDGWTGTQSDPDDVSWRRAHEELVRLAKAHAGLDFEEGRWLLRAFRTSAHARLGYGSFNEYAERLFGYAPRVTQDKLRVATALEGLPETARALDSGAASFSAVRELTRVATPDTEREWLDAAAGRSVREIEQLVSGQRPGSRPQDVPVMEAVRHVIRLDVSGETLATFREAMATIRRAAGEHLDDDAAVLVLARNVLGGPRDEGRASYQIAITTCDRCRRATQQGRGELVEVDPEVAEMAACDGQHVGKVDAHVGADGPDSASPRATQTIPPALRRSVLRRDGRHCQVPGCRHGTFVDVHHIVPRADGGRNVAENLLTLCSAHHRAIHRGELLLDTAPDGAHRFFHADGTEYGNVPTAAFADARARAARALRWMGFRETEAQRALARVSAEPATSAEHLIRAALRELG